EARPGRAPRRPRDGCPQRPSPRAARRVDGHRNDSTVRPAARRARQPAAREPGVVRPAGSPPAPPPKDLEVRLEAAPPATPPATPATRALLARLGRIDGERASLVLGAAQRFDGRLRLRGVAHLDEAEALALARRAVGDDRGALDRSVRREQPLEGVVVD